MRRLDQGILCTRGEHPNPLGKPMEDYSGVQMTSFGLLAVVADGLSQVRDEAGEYPQHSGRAAETAVDELLIAFRRQGKILPEQSEAFLIRSLAQANERIGTLNRSLGHWEIPDPRFKDRIATTCVAALIVPDPTGILHLTVVSVGDALALLTRGDEPRASVLSRNQVRLCQEVGYTYFTPERLGVSYEEAQRQRRAWQRSVARNNLEATSLLDSEVRVGYGVLDGNSNARSFFDVGRAIMQPGDRLVLASDALRVLEDADHAPDASARFQSIANLVADTSVTSIPERLIRAIRVREVRTRARSDDATVIVVAPS